MYYTIFLSILLIVSAGGGERAGRARCGGSGGGQGRDRQARVQEWRQGLQAAEFGRVGAQSPGCEAGERAGHPRGNNLVYNCVDPQMWDRYL